MPGDGIQERVARLSRLTKNRSRSVRVDCRMRYVNLGGNPNLIADYLGKNHSFPQRNGNSGNGRREDPRRRFR